MAYLLQIETVGDFTTTFTFLDGDPKLVTNPDRSIVVGVNPPERLMAPFCGRPIDPTHLPTRLQPSGRRRALADMIGSPIGYICSDKVKTVVESLEPGVHAFYPVTFEWKTGAPMTGHYVWIIQQSIKGLHPDHLTPPYPGPDKFWDGLRKRMHPDGHAVFSAQRLGGAHAWSDPQLSYALCLSDALTQALLDAGVSGFAPSYHIDVL